jgi:hypothetical protein
MAYQQKRSSVVGKVPTVADFGSDTGQLIINTADGKIYMLVGGVVRAFTNDDDLPATAPIGSIIMMASDDKIVPPGCLLMNGAPVTATYPELRAHGIAAGWERNAAGDPLTPDMGGYIARGWRPGQLVDAGRIFGTVQQDALQDHGHPILGSGGSVAATIDARGLMGGNGVPNSGDIASNPRYRNASTNPAANNESYIGISSLLTNTRTASETRPINRTFTYWVKAYPAKVDTGSIDLANLTRDIQGVATSISDLESLMQAKLDAMQKQFFGNGQVWQSVSRPANTVFQNTTGKTIFITVNISSGYGTFQMSPDNVNWSTASEIGGGSMWVMGMPIPNGYYYKTGTGGTYRELR